jgi:RNA polymerase sigma-70 factor (ECF subfamily)
MTAFPLFFLTEEGRPGPIPRARGASPREPGQTSGALATSNAEHDTGRTTAEVPLVEAIRAGDPVTFRALYHDLYQELAAFAWTITHSRDLADDAVQIAMTRLWLARESFTPHSSVRAYLFTAVRRNALDVLRRDRHIAAAEYTAHGAGTSVSAAIPLPDAQLESAEWSRAIAHAVAELPPRAREVFLLSRRFSLSHAEIAAVLGISANTVMNHMARALQGIAAALDTIGR